MWQTVIVAIIGVAVLGLVGYRIYEVIMKPPANPCDGCPGCALKDNLKPGEKITCPSDMPKDHRK